MSDYCYGNVYIPRVCTPQTYSSSTVQFAVAAHIEWFQAYNTCLLSCKTDASCYWL